jgi:hypothetical protein
VVAFHGGSEGNATPVLPLVASTTVPPGLSSETLGALNHGEADSIFDAPPGLSDSI